MENVNQTERGGKRRLVIAAIVLVLLVAAGLIFGPALMPDTTAGKKTVTVNIIHGDGSTSKNELVTDEEYLGAALMTYELIEGDEGPYGLFVTGADGETVDAANEEWWCLTKGGETVMTGVDMTPIVDGDAFELTFTVGYGEW